MQSRSYCARIALVLFPYVVLASCESGRPVRSRAAAWQQGDPKGAGTPELAADPERFSGADATREGARILAVDGKATGRVSFRDGNKTDWVRVDPRAMGLLHLELELGADAIGLQVTLVDELGERPLKLSETIEMFNVKPLHLRITASEPLAQGTYALLLSGTEAAATVLSGQVLRFNGQKATLDLGGEDGMKAGLRGFIERKDRSKVPFKVTRVLRRTSSVEVGASLGPEDLGAQARVKQEKVLVPPKAP